MLFVVVPHTRPMADQPAATLNGDGPSSATLSSSTDLTPMKAATVVNAVKIALGTAGVSTGATPAVRVAGTGETSLQAPTDQSKETVRVKVCGRRAVVSHPLRKRRASYRRHFFLHQHDLRSGRIALRP